ncbi:MAG: aminopeptidase P family protein [Bacteroidia bacterium]|nr:aminopeptidase P family protein [Bacteroidia bacterium]
MLPPAPLDLLRAELARRNLDACILPNTDPHQSEYLAPHWQGISWLSGFTGSAATLAVTASFAGLWTDSRYFIQAARELAGSGVTLMKLRVPHTPEFIEWLCTELPAGARVGIDGRLFALPRYRELEQRLQAAGMHLEDAGDLLAPVWQERPGLPLQPVYSVEALLPGPPRAARLESVRSQMAARNLDWHLLAAVDDIAWVFNLRGSDVPFNPVFLAFALIGRSSATLFLHPEQVTHALKAELAAAGVTLAHYTRLPEVLGSLARGSQLLLDPATTSIALRRAIPEGVTVQTDASLPAQAKVRKGPEALAAIRQAMVRDGIAWVQMLCWLESALRSGQPVTEYSLAQQLETFRSADPSYRGPSFPSIVGYGPQGAIVHYRPEAEHAAQILPEGLLLIDAGGQYLHGTTDMTRTWALGEPSPVQQTHYTLVLKGMIALSRAVFPAAARGVHLDVLARQFLWQEGLNYGHGTGHGVGFFLCVHESPPGISPAASGPAQAPLEPGMVLSNEPGLYLEGQYGIRIENLIAVQPWPQAPESGFLAFETLSLCPIDLRLLDLARLTDDERGWLNAYHQRVLDALSPGLAPAEQAWLHARCAHI